jgi:hypothetical protein
MPVVAIRIAATLRTSSRLAGLRRWFRSGLVSWRCPTGAHGWIAKVSFREALRSRRLGQPIRPDDDRP